jgi:hypothetical protein
VDASRYGGRASVDVSLQRDFRIHGDFGVRGVESESEYTYSYTAEVRKTRFGTARLSASLRIGGFSGPHASGLNPSLRVGRTFGGGHSVHLAYGSYLYELASADTERVNQWVRVHGQIELPARLYFSGHYEYDWGNDAEGHRLFGEVGYRF